MTRDVEDVRSALRLDAADAAIEGRVARGRTAVTVLKSLGNVSEAYYAERVLKGKIRMRRSG